MAHLNNADFRKIMMTPMANRMPTRPGEKDDKTPTKSTPAPKEQPKKKYDPKRAARKKEYLERKKQKEDDEPKYRDRAAERRKGNNKDYDEDEDLKTKVVEAQKEAGKFRILGGGFAAREKEIAKSKYLGGDVQYTHLVKGLDYALLERVKRENEEKEREEKVKKVREGMKREKEKRQKERRSQEDKFATDLGRKLHDILFSEREDVVGETFLPHRTAYKYDVSTSMFASEVPMIITRSKADCPDFGHRSYIPRLKPDISTKVGKIYQYVRKIQEANRGLLPAKRKRRKAEKPLVPVETGIRLKNMPTPAVAAHVPSIPTTSAQPKHEDSEPELEEEPKRSTNDAPPPPASDGFSIFPESGSDYVCELPAESEKKPAPKAPLSSEEQPPLPDEAPPLPPGEAPPLPDTSQPPLPPSGAAAPTAPLPPLPPENASAAGADVTAPYGDYSQYYQQPAQPAVTGDYGAYAGYGYPGYGAPAAASGAYYPEQVPADVQHQYQAQYAQYMSNEMTSTAAEVEASLLPLPTITQTAAPSAMGDRRDGGSGVSVLPDGTVLTQTDKDRGFGSILRTDEKALKRTILSEKEKNVDFVSSYEECYPGASSFESFKQSFKSFKAGFGSDEEDEGGDDGYVPKPTDASNLKRKRQKQSKFNNDYHRIMKLVEEKRSGAGGDDEDDAPSKRARA